MAANDNNGRRWYPLSRSGRLRLAEALRILRALNRLRGPADTEVREQYERKLRDRLRDIDRGADVRQLSLFGVLLLVVGCEGAFTSAFRGGDADAAVGAGGALVVGGTTGAGGLRA